MDLQEASVVLTGGSRGLGPHIARALLSRGARVTLAARSAPDLERARDDLDSNRVATVAGDVANEEDRAAILADAEAAFGPVDVLINNAGIEFIRPFTDYTAEEIRGTIEVNLEAALQLCLLALPGMLERGRGHVVNVSSLAGKAAVPYNTVYAATKHGLVGFTYSLRAELHGTGVGVSVVCPGFVSEAGMFADRHFPTVPKGSGTGTTPRAVASAVVRAIERNKPDIVVSGLLPKISDVAFAVSPSLADAVARRSGTYELQRREAEVQTRQGENT
jgi:short-subunit dehydrogenase